MNYKDTTLYSLVTVRCPRCHKGKMFPEGTLYNPVRFAKMNDHCAECGLAFAPEPGYYFGAMFISYAINTGWLLLIWAALLLVVDTITTTMLIGILAFVVIGLLPLTFRWSRVLWISIFVRRVPTPFTPASGGHRTSQH